MDSILDVIAGIAILWLTYRIYRVLASKYQIVSFSGFIGHMWGHFDLLLWSLLGACAIVGLVAMIFESIFSIF
ncbi:MAG: hypothetical protein E7204_05545 [Veillonella sp.]|uniref:hypothetical protein n=1 Tax=Veillonella sp. TaxID=1926307 RepID=UPI0025E3623B|nr:hypothetical protein [Veillonella sp.]MBE6080290.1 hypothetical protein [Veillonella sp.]